MPISMKIVLGCPLDYILIRTYDGSCQSGTKPLPKPLLTQFTEAYMSHWTPMSLESYERVNMEIFVPYWHIINLISARGFSAPPWSTFTVEN